MSNNDNNLKREIDSLKENNVAAIDRLQSSNEKAIGELRTGHEKAIGGLRTDFGELRTDFEKLRTDIGRGVNKLIMVLIAIGGVSVAVVSLLN